MRIPERCYHGCGEKGLMKIETISYSNPLPHNGKLIIVNIPNLQIPICQGCGEKVFTEDVDEQIEKVWQRMLDDSSPDFG